MSENTQKIFNTVVAIIIATVIISKLGIGK